MVEYFCQTCNKNYATYQTFWFHNRKFHKTQNNENTSENISENTSENICETINEKTSQEIIKQYICQHCSKIFKYRQYRWKHQKSCKYGLFLNILTNQLPNKLASQLASQLASPHIIQPVVQPVVQLNKEDYIKIGCVNIMVHSKNNYINAIQICQIEDKNFNVWNNLESTKILIDTFESLNNCKGLIIDNLDYWIHPQLAIQLAGWVSPLTGLYLISWFNNKYVKEINNKNDRIKILESTYLKKQPRINYPDNVIYLITSESNKNKRIYIVGKASILKNRLSSYNKIEEHEVIYYKECENKHSMKIVESIILTKLNEYREKINRDRFILPHNKSINFFINIINESFII